MNQRLNSFSFFLVCQIFLSSLTVIAANNKGKLPEVVIPHADEWSREQVVLLAGPEGSWDSRLFGQISPCTVVKKNNNYYLYYIGARGNRTTDGGPAHRALGLATSSDGIHFTKYADNPILKHLPQNNQEEGIFSGGSILDKNGNILLYLGAIIAGNSYTESVQCNAGLAVSSNGLHYEDQGYVFSWDEKRVWGHGDEISPIGAFCVGGKYHIYYIAKSQAVSWGLGLASGDSKTNFSRFTKVKDDAKDIIGGGDPIRISDEKIAIFLVKDFNNNTVEVMTASVDHPEKLSGPVREYPMFQPNYRHTTVFLDRDRKMWYMYQSSDQPSNGNKIIVRTAPMKLVDVNK